MKLSSKLCAFAAIAGCLAAPVGGTQGAPAAQIHPGSFLRADDFRVATVAYRLAVAGRPHCPLLVPLSGLFLHYLPEYDLARRGEASRLYGVDRGPGILSVAPASPAAAAGLRAGDVLISGNGTPFPTGGAMAGGSVANSWRKAADQIEIQLEEQLRLGPLRLAVLRQGRELAVTLNSTPGCPIRARLARSNQANAFANGHMAIVTTRLLGFVRNDDELAIVLAHEAAHNILGHPARLEAEKVPKGILANFGKNAKRVRVTEEEADRLSVRLLWSAGYDVSAIIPFWRRLYRTYDPIPTPKLFSKHPSLGDRERIVAEELTRLGQAQDQPPR